MFSINLKEHNAFPWKRYKNIIYRGYFYDKSPETFCEEILQELRETAALEKYLKTVRGNFSIIIDENDECIIISDIARSFPVFISVKNHIITDNIEIRDNDKLNTEELRKFILRRNTSDGQTLLDDYEVVSNSEIMYLTEQGARRQKYYAHMICGEKSNKSELKVDFSKMMDKVFSRLLSDLPQNSRIIIPLSGGYDSRLIISKLITMGLRDRIVAYTYGIPGDYEVEYAKKVASKLEVKWFFCNYSRQAWDEIFSTYFNDMRKYIEYSFNYCSLPHLQDFICIHKLIREGIITKGDIIVPGYCGDFPAGSFIPSDETVMKSANKLARFTFNKHFINTTVNDNNKEIIIRSLEAIFSADQKQVFSFDEGVRKYERWAIDTRLTMWVLNSLRLYEFFGLEWRIPMWDMDYLDFWYSISNVLRKKCVFYREIIFEQFFDSLGIGYKKPTAAESPNRSNVIKDAIRKVLTFLSFKTGSLLYNRNNTNNYNYASLLLYKKMKDHRMIDYNTMSLHSIEMLWLCEWTIGIDNCLDVLRGNDE